MKLMLFLNRNTSSGFTLLEMLVVVLLVSLLAGLLMQGFLYVARVYHVVERNKEREQSKVLFNGWLRDSTRGLLNGYDRDESIQFSGFSDRFSGVSSAPLLSDRLGQLHSIEWRIEDGASVQQLRYGESLISSGEMSWVLIKEWKDANVSWVYLVDGEWLPQYPGVLIFEDRPERVLPDAIALRIQTRSEDQFIVSAVVSAKSNYLVPEAFSL